MKSCRRVGNKTEQDEMAEEQRRTFFPMRKQSFTTDIEIGSKSLLLLISSTQSQPSQWTALGKAHRQHHGTSSKTCDRTIDGIRILSARLLGHGRWSQILQYMNKIELALLLDGHGKWRLATDTPGGLLARSQDVRMLGCATSGHYACTKDVRCLASSLLGKRQSIFCKEKGVAYG